MTGAEAKAMREAAGLNRTQVAALIGVTERTIYRYEDGETSISGPAAIAIRHALAPLPAKRKTRKAA